MTRLSECAEEGVSNVKTGDLNLETARFLQKARANDVSCYLEAKDNFKKNLGVRKVIKNRRH